MNLSNKALKTNIENLFDLFSYLERHRGLNKI